MVKVQTVLISVYDKSGLVEFAQGLHALGIKILSTGGTAKLLRQAGIPVEDVSARTGFPEILDGRVKTLHPVIHGGLLALRHKNSHLEEIKKQKIAPIDMVVVNLYPFSKVIQKKNVTLGEALENIDIGGPSMLRSAAKNFKSVAVVSNPARYKDILSELDNNKGILSDAVLFKLAVETFQKTSQYDDVIFNYLNSRIKDGSFSGWPQELCLHFVKVQELRYGENPHQAAALYRERQRKEGLPDIRQLHGKELSFNNFMDLNAALGVVKDFDRPAAVIIKHNNPTGVAESTTLKDAYRRVWQSDPVSAFGGIIGCNRKVDKATADLIIKSGFRECVIAPGYDRQAFKMLSQKKNLRIIEMNMKDLASSTIDLRQVQGGLLVQDRDAKVVDPKEIRIVTKKKPTARQVQSLLFGWNVIKHIRSNAVILVKDTHTVGIGCGQTSRIESTMLAIKKAGKQAKNSFLVSDAFIPKTDNVTVAAKAGIKAIIQTGGSIADPDVIKAADKAGMAMVMTGVRHFKH